MKVDEDIFTVLRDHERDYYLGRWEDEGGLVLEPYCHCGSVLEENFVCPSCGRPCSCSYVVCEDARAFEAVEKLINGSPQFRDFETSLLVRK